MEPYTEEEKREIEARINTPKQGRSYGTYFFIDLILDLAWNTAARNILPFHSLSQSLAALVAGLIALVGALLDLGLVILPVLWIIDLVKRSREKKNKQVR